MALENYPPPVHVLRDLGIEMVRSAETGTVARLAVTPHLLGADGGVRAGVLAVLVDVVGGSTAVEALHPDRMATADLSLQLVQPAVGPYVEARASVVRRGRTTLVIEVDLANSSTPLGVELSDAGSVGSDTVGWAVLSFAVLERQDAPADGGATDAAAAGEPVARPPLGQHMFVGGSLDEPILDALSITTDGDAPGRVSMPVVEYVHNTLGAVQGGVMALVGEVAGTGSVGEALGLGQHVAAVDLHVTYLALGRRGPITTTTEDAWSDPGTGAGGALVELVDEGLAGRLNTVVSVVAVAS